MSKTQIRIGEAVGLILGLTGVGIQMLWPEQRWLGWVFIGLGIAIGFGVIVWIWAQQVALKSLPTAIALSPPAAQSLTQHAPISNTNTNTFNPTINVHQSQAQLKEQSRLDDAALRRKQQSDLLVIGIQSSTVRPAYLNEQGRVATQSRVAMRDQYPLQRSDVAFVKLFREDESEISRLIVKARIYFFKADMGAPLYVVDLGYWYSEERKHPREVVFSVPHTAELIIGTIPEPSVVIPYDGQYIPVGRLGMRTLEDFNLNSTRLEGGEFLVRVHLMGTERGVLVLKMNIDYLLSLSSPPYSLTFQKATRYHL